LTELWRGKRLGSEASVVNAWSMDDLDAALERLESRGYANSS
jgi:hypothetical protein